MIKIGLLFSLVIIWGSSFLLMKYSLKAFSADEVASLRLAIAGLSTAPLAIRYLIKKKGKYPFGNIFITCMVGNFFPAYLFAFAMMKIPSGTGGILNALTPIFTLIIGAVVFRTSLTVPKILGILIGWIGAMMVLLMNSGAPGAEISGEAWIYVGMCIFATMLYGYNANFVKEKLMHIKPVELVSLIFLVALIPSGLYLASTDFIYDIIHHPQGWASLMWVSILGLVNTSLSAILFWTLADRSNILFAASVTYFMPIVSLMLGYKDGETIYLGQIIGMPLILLGVWLAGLKKVPGRLKRLPESQRIE